MTGDTPETLFTASESERAPKDGPILLITNRYNLLEFLSAGFVAPATAIPKYYADLLEISPGRLPFVRGGVSESVAAWVSREDPTAFPVALEIDETAFGDRPLPALDAGRTVGDLSIGNAEAVAWAPYGLLPLRLVRKIHFRSTQELEEHAAREYENIPPAVAELAASPNLFAGGGLESEIIEAFLTRLPLIEGHLADELEMIDRLHGACCTVLAVAPASADVLRGALDLSVPTASITRGASSHKGVPPWLTRSALAGEKGARPGAEAGLFRVAAWVLRRQDRSAAWRPLEVLGEVEAAISTEGLAKKDVAEVTKNLRPIGAILRNERDFKPFESGVGLDAAKALLLLLLRPDPIRLAGWNRDETGADDAVMMGALAFAGLLRGHKKLPLELRTPALDALLADRAAAQVAVGWPEALPPPATADPLLTESDDDGGGTRITVTWADGIVVERFRAAPSLTEMLLAADADSPKLQAVAVELCRRLDWSECVATVVTASEGAFVLDTGSKLVRIRVPGVASVTHEVDTVALRARLSSAPLPKDVETDLRARFETGAPGQPD